MAQHWSLASLSMLGMLWAGGSPSTVASMQMAQAPFSNLGLVEQLNAPNWQPVPGAAVGRHPEETLMDISGIARQGYIVTFDVMGHRGVYYRMTGDCETRHVDLTRRGLSQDIDAFLYEEVEPNSAEVSDWNRLLLTFACQVSDSEKNNQNEVAQTKQNLGGQSSGYILNISGTLRAGGTTLSDGSLYEPHSFTGRTSQEVQIVMESTEFDTFLFLLGPPGGEMIAHTGDIGRSRNSVLTTTLPRDGTYIILANGFDRNSRGRYTLRVQNTSGGSPVVQGQTESQTSQTVQDLPDGRYFFEAPRGAERFNTPSGNIEYFFQKQGNTVTGIAIFDLAHNSCFSGNIQGNTVANLTWAENEITGTRSEWRFFSGQPLDLASYQQRPYEDSRFSRGTNTFVQNCVDAFSTRNSQ